MDRKQKINELKNLGLSYQSIGKLFGISRARVHQIYSGYRTLRHDKNGYNQKLYCWILRRDNFECKWGEKCKNKKVRIKDLVIHHIDLNPQNSVSGNLITLCKYCHSSFHRRFHIDDKKERELQESLCKEIEKKCPQCHRKFITTTGKEERTFCSHRCAATHTITNWRKKGRK